MGIISRFRIHIELKYIIATLLISSSLVLISGELVYAQNQNQSVQQFKKPKNNKKKIKANKRKNRGRKGEKASSKDIAGRKLRRNTTPRQTYARPQPSPYVGRKTYGQADRPSAQPPPNFRKPPGNDKPRSKDITGRRVRPRQPSSTRRDVYSSSGASQRSKRRSESSIARNAGKYSTQPQSASRPSERAKVSAGGRPPSRSGRVSITRAKNPYKGKQQRDGEKGSSKDIAGRKLRTRNAVSPRPGPRGGYRAPDTYFGRKPKGDRPSFSSKRMAPSQFRSASKPSETSSDQTAKGSAPGFKNYRSSRPQFKSTPKPYAGRQPGKEGSFYKDTKPKRVRSISAKVKAKNVLSVQIFPKSISGQRKPVVRSKDPYKGRYQREGERGSSKDIAGRKLRTRGYVSPRPNWEKAVGKNDVYYGRKFRGDQPAAPLSGGFKSSNRAKWNNQGRAVPSRAPSNSQIKANQYQGNVRARKPLKGGGTTSRKQWNNMGNAIPSKGPSSETSRATQFRGRFKSFQIQPSFNEDYINYQGNMKARKPLKGAGGTTSRKQWNNMGTAIPSRSPSSETSRATQFQGRFKTFQLQPTFNDDYINYQGNMRAKKPLRGAGGSKSRGQWNNNFQPLEGRGPTRSGLQASRYQGNLRAKRPIKGAGGSVKRGTWNNNNQAIEGRGPSRMGLQASRYQGNLRAKRPPKGGGGSMERGNWNNNNQAIEGRGPSRTGLQASRYQGNIKSKGKPTVSSESKKAAKYQGYHKETRINPLQKTAAFFTKKDYRPRTKPAEGLDYGRTKTLSFLPNRKVKNYGGFVKAEFKSNKKDWHPSYKYSDKSATEEKEKTFKFRIWWASLFNKNESLPQSVKKEEKRPRYSKDESKIWYE